MNQRLQKGRFFLLVGSVLILVLSTSIGFLLYQEKNAHEVTKTQCTNDLSVAGSTFLECLNDLENLESQDQLLINNDLRAKQASIEATYADAVTVYEELQDLQDLGKSTKYEQFEIALASVLDSLSKSEFATASGTLTQLQSSVSAEKARLIAASAPIQTSLADLVAAPASNTAPSSGYSRQSVQAAGGAFTVSLIAADLSGTKVIVDTASGGDCANDCPVLSLGDYVSRNGGFAGINGSYFCPASYPSCAGKTNSFDLLVMNKDKVYFNSANNVYSSNPAVIFGSDYVRFVGAASQWGRDTGVNGVLSNYPLLVSGGQSKFAGDGDEKKSSHSNRSFVAKKGSTIYIGVVHGASVAESAQVLAALGMDDALNLDSGGSTALWSGGYKVGPGRNIPNAIVFVRK